MPPVLTPPRVSSFAGRLLDHPAGDTAVVTATGSLTYGELGAAVRDAAAELGATRRLVLLPGANTVRCLVLYLAALSAGHVVLLVPEGNGIPGWVERYDPDVVVAAGGQVRERRAGTTHDLHPDLALLLTTSGSTGSPKLVRLSHTNLEANAQAIADVLGVRSDDRALTTLPLHYCYGLSVVHSHLLRGAGIVLTDLSVVDACLWQLFRDGRATTFAAVPYTFDLLDRVGFAEMDLPSLRYVTQAGGRLAPERVRAYAALGRRRGFELVVMYGQTEATARMACLPAGLAERHPGAIGRAVPGGQFRLDPPEGCLRPGVGELVYTGPNVMLGYATDPADLADGATLCELRTGDLARRTDDGLYEIVGRCSRTAKVFGLRVDLQHVEEQMRAGGLPACCVAVQDQVVALVTEPPGPAVRHRLARACGLPARAVRVVGVDALPRTESGKVDLAAAARLAGRPPEAPAGSSASDTPALCALYADVLERDDVDPSDTFAGLGGDSLSYVELSLRLEQALGHLPESWHVTPIGRLAPAARPSGSRVETSVVLRAVAILLILGSHAHLFSLVGGAHALIGVAGFNFARFQLGGADVGALRRGVARAARRIALPTVVAAAAGLALGYGNGWASVLLVNDLLGPDPLGPGWRYWTVEALVQVLVVAGALLSVPALWRLERRRPVAFAVAVTAVGAVTGRLLVDRLGPVPDALQSGPAVLWLFGLGWWAARARSSLTGRLAVSAAAVALVPGWFGEPRREAVILGALLLLVWTASLPVPRRLRAGTAVLAAASLHLYVGHWLLPESLDRLPVVAFALSVAVGLAYWRLCTAGGSWLAGRRRKGRARHPLPLGVD